MFLEFFRNYVLDSESLFYLLTAHIFPHIFNS